MTMTMTDKILYLMSRYILASVWCGVVWLVRNRNPETPDINA